MLASTSSASARLRCSANLQSTYCDGADLLHPLDVHKVVAAERDHGLLLGISFTLRDALLLALAFALALADHGWSRVLRLARTFGMIPLAERTRLPEQKASVSLSSLLKLRLPRLL